MAIKDNLLEERRGRWKENCPGHGRREGERQEVGGRDNQWVNYQLLLGWQQNRRQGLNQMYSHDLPAPDKHPAATHCPHLPQALSQCLG